MAIRIRRINGKWAALCAAETVAWLGDIYLDDAQDHAVRKKLFADWDGEPPKPCPTCQPTPEPCGERCKWHSHGMRCFNLSPDNPELWCPACKGSGVASKEGELPERMSPDELPIENEKLWGGHGNE